MQPLSGVDRTHNLRTVLNQLQYVRTIRPLIQCSTFITHKQTHT